MANSKYDFHADDEKLTDLRFNRGTYIIVRVDGHKFHRFCPQHNFHKPNDKRALDLMVDSAKNVMKTYKGHIPLAFGHSDEFSFLIRSTSNLLARRMFKISSMIPVIFATYYNSNWDRYFADPLLGEVTSRKSDALFDARPKEYANYKAVIEYFRWRQVDCHINNLYNTTLNALTGRYIRHELIPKNKTTKDFPVCDSGERESFYKLKRTPITEWITHGKFLNATEATERLSGTVSSDKHDIMFCDHKINYNNELEQFRKGTVIVDCQTDYDGSNTDPSSIRHFYKDIIKSPVFWHENQHIFDDYVSCPPPR